MSFDHLQEQWKTSFEKAISSIEHCLIPQLDDYQDLTEFRTLANWLTNTSLSGYEFMPIGYQNYSHDPYSMDSLLSLIHHALIDDGDISFVTMHHDNKIMRVFMIFCSQHEDNFRDFCLKENASIINLRIDYAKRSNIMRDNMRIRFPNNPHVDNKTIPEEKDFTFVVHRNALQFISEVDTFESLKKKQREDSEKNRQAFINNM